MSGKKILMLTGEFTEEYEIYVFQQGMEAVGHTVHVVCPDKKRRRPHQDLAARFRRRPDLDREARPLRRHQQGELAILSRHQFRSRIAMCV